MPRLPKQFPKLVNECGLARIESLVIIAAGFRKSAKLSKATYKELKILIRKFRMRIIGPNSLGIINVNYGLNASFARRMAKRGGIAFISQSGALCASVWIGLFSKMLASVISSLLEPLLMLAFMI